LTLTAVANDAAATVTGDGVHALKPGANALAVTVTAADGVTTKTYRVIVTRAVSASTTPGDTTANEAVLPSIITSVYPNPTAETVYVEVAEPALLEVFALNGRMVFRKETGAGVQAVTLEKSGIYIIKVSSGDRVSVKRVVRR
ncbi:MAG: T9SS type A sorting domain-containing protein, partial [Bacteroidales bacterium]|nr:T9SS type A sorting domain-containing protein [Bacteroidales bacterium]